MKLTRFISIAVLAVASGAFAAQPGDIVLTPSAGGGVTITDATGNATRLRVADDGSVTIPGTLFKNANSFLHASGTNNTFVGELAGNFTLTGGNNTGIGAGTLFFTTTGAGNTAVGGGALVLNTTGAGNSALGYNALLGNTTGANNTATGASALQNNTTGIDNTAVGVNALKSNTTGQGNTAIGKSTLAAVQTGLFNIAIGDLALNFGKGNYNIAVGPSALHDANGDSNIAIGIAAGQSLFTGSDNIQIGTSGPGVDESNTIRIGRSQDHNRAFIAGIRGVTTGSANAVPVMIDSTGQLGTASSSERFKDDIADMGEASDALMSLRPVTFHYKVDQDPAGRTLQYGLIAEEVAQVYPGLVAHSPDGQVETVMVQFLPAMLLNEVQKQRRTIERLERALAAMQQRLGLSPEESK